MAEDARPTHDAAPAAPADAGPNAEIHALMAEASAAMGHLMQLVPALMTQEFGISRPRMFALGALQMRAMPQRDLAEATMTSPSACSRLVDQLEEDGLVERTPSPADRRTTLVGLTDAGRALMARMQRRQDTLMDTVIAEVGTDVARTGANAIMLLAGRLATVVARELED